MMELLENDFERVMSAGLARMRFHAAQENLHGREETEEASGREPARLQHRQDSFWETTMIKENWNLNNYQMQARKFAVYPERASMTYPCAGSCW